MPQSPTPAESLSAFQSRYEGINAFKRQTRAEEAELWAEVYVWWRDVRDPADFLAASYQQQNIANYNTAGINFRPLLKLVSKNEITESNLNIWTAALRSVHEDFQANPQHYRHDPVGAIKHFVLTHGGKTGLRSGRTADDLDCEDAPLESMLFTLDDKEFIPTYQTSLVQHYQHVSAPTLQNAIPLKLTRDGYSVVWVKQDAQGIVILGSNNDAEVLRNVALSHYREDFEATPTTLRTVLEPLHILNLPRTIAQSEAKFLERSKVDDPWETKRKELSHKRLIYRPASRDFLLSQTQVDAAVVLIAKPKLSLIERTSGDIFLRTSTRQSIENRLLHGRAFNLFSTPHSEKFQALPEGFLASHTVKLENKLTIDDSKGISGLEVEQHITNFNHPSFSFIPFYQSFGPPRWQVDANPESFEALWHGMLDLAWLRELNGRFLASWIKEYGAKSTRPENKNFKLKFLDDVLTISFEFSRKSFDVTSDFKLPAGSGDAELMVRTKDFAFVLAQMADLPITSSIDLRVGQEALVMQFETAASDYKCWIPGATESGHRQAKHFKSYLPTQTEDLPKSEDPDDWVDEPSQAELDQIAANIKRIRSQHESS